MPEGEELVEQLRAMAGEWQSRKLCLPTGGWGALNRAADALEATECDSVLVEAAEELERRAKVDREEAEKVAPPESHVCAGMAQANEEAADYLRNLTASPERCERCGGEGLTVRSLAVTAPLVPCPDCTSPEGGEGRSDRGLAAMELAPVKWQGRCGGTGKLRKRPSAANGLTVYACPGCPDCTNKRPEGEDDPLLVSGFWVLGGPVEPPIPDAEPIRVERTGRIERGTFEPNADVWAIRQAGRCYGRDGTWDFEPLPSARTDEWFANYRWTLDEARAALTQQEEEK